MNLAGILTGLLTYALLNNVVLSRFLGICPFLGVSKKSPTAIGMGLAVVSVITVSSALTYLINIFVFFGNFQFFLTFKQIYFI